jgi:CheY-like chemotaxis protein
LDRREKNLDTRTKNWTALSMKTTDLPTTRTKPARRLWGLFTLPRRACAELPPPRPSPQTPPPPLPRGQKILVVDDDAVLRKTTALKLISQGYEVVTAVDAAAAIGAVRKEKPDLILLDINFPPDVAHGGSMNWDGFLIMTWLQRIESARHIPVIIITGGEPAKYEQRALSSGAAGFFQKPLNHDLLLSTINRAVERKATRQSSPADFQI